MRHGNLLNHLTFGKHKIDPEKTTMRDYALGVYVRRLKDFIHTKSLFSAHDADDSVVAASVPFLHMGWALRTRKVATRYPEQAKKFAVEFFRSRMVEGKRVGIVLPSIFT